MVTQRQIAVISGASRGIGKGIAIALGREGYRVHLAGRATPPRSDEASLPGTLEETALAVKAAGGEAVIEPCDMAVDDDVRRLFARIADTSGGLDLLVNNAAFLHNDMNKPDRFWEKSDRIADIIDVGLRCHYLALHHAVPLMLGRGAALAVNVSFFSHAGMHDPAYCAAKAGLDAMAASAARDLESEGLACVSLWPGVVLTERLAGILEQMPALRDDLPPLETPDLIGRTVAALKQDGQLASLNGKTLIVAELAARYGLAMEDGSAPHSMRGALGTPHPRNDISETIATQ